MKKFSNENIPGVFWCGLLLASSMLILGWFISSAEVGALLFTAVFIAWYSIETSKTRKEMILANQISIQPALVLEYHQEGANGGDPSFILKNIGIGGAMNVEIDSSNEDFYFNLQGLNTMKGGEEKQVFLVRSRSGKGLVREEWEDLSESPVVATICFERTKKSHGEKVYFKTEVEIKNPHGVRIVDTNWIPG